jgi:hypothetical protein
MFPERRLLRIVGFRSCAWRTYTIRPGGADRTPETRPRRPRRDASKVRHHVFRLTQPSTPVGCLSRAYTMSYALWQEKFHFLGFVVSRFVAQFNHRAPPRLAKVGGAAGAHAAGIRFLLLLRCLEAKKRFDEVPIEVTRKSCRGGETP